MEQIDSEMTGYGFGGPLVLVIYVAIIIIPFWKIWTRTGHSGWMSLLMLVPLLNIIMLYVLAFKNWPAVPDRPAVE